MKFVPVPIGAGDSKGQRVLFSIWETRSKDYAAFMKSGSYTMSGEDADDWKTCTYGDAKIPVGRGAGETVEESRHPVANVSLADAVAFCSWLTKKDRASGLIGPQDEYRLPTDIEWSYAVGIGEKEDPIASPQAKLYPGVPGIYPWGTSYPPRTKVGNYFDEDAKSAGLSSVFTLIKDYHDGYATTAIVGSYPPNGLGIYDLGGNLWEWTSTLYEPGDDSHALRGVSWFGAGALGALSSFRSNHDAGSRIDIIGFRCVLVVVSEKSQTAPSLSSLSEISKPAPNRPTLPASGYFTLDDLFSNTPYSKFTTYGLRRIVGEVQAILKKEGLYQKAIDNLPGPGTQEALFQWQELHGIQNSGKLDLATLTAMNLLNRRDERPPGLPAVTAERVASLKGLIGKWVRQDNNYIIRVTRVYDNGQIEASYHNPSLGYIPVEVAYILPESRGADFFMKLDRETYSGSEYTLTLKSNNLLSGQYVMDPTGLRDVSYIDFDRSR